MKTCSHCGCIYDDNEKRCPSCKSSRIKISNNKSHKNIAFIILLSVSILFLILKIYILFFVFLILSVLIITSKKTVIKTNNNSVKTHVQQDKKQDKIMPEKLYEDIKLYLSADDAYEAKWVYEAEKNQLTEYYFIEEDEELQKRFIQALSKTFNIIKDFGSDNGAIIEDKYGKRFYTSLNGCTCKSYCDNGEFCQHMIYYAKNKNYINEIGIIRDVEHQKHLQNIIKFLIKVSDENEIKIKDISTDYLYSIYSDKEEENFIMDYEEVLSYILKCLNKNLISESDLLKLNYNEVL